MKTQFQYLSDTKGTPTAVVIPINDWISFQKEHSRLRQYVKLKTRLMLAFEEFDEIKNGKKKTISLRDFLNEC